MNRDGSRLAQAIAGRRVESAGVPGAGEPSVEVVHAAVPGRVRLRVPSLKRDAAGAAHLERTVAGWPGVRRASASPTTGSLLLEFEPGEVAAERLAAQVQAVVVQLAYGKRASSGREGWDTNGAGPSAERRAGIDEPQPTLAGLDLDALLEAAPVPPPLRPRARAVEAAIGAAVIAGAGALLLAVRAHGHNLAIDHVPLELAEEVHAPALTAVMRGASRLAEPGVVGPLTLGAALMGVGRRSPRDVPWLAPVAVAGGGVLISLLKTMLGRPRPDAFEPLSAARGSSLPSGHAFIAMCLYGLLADHGLRWLRARRPDDRRFGAAVLSLAVAAVLLVGISRVYLGVHYPTDVLAGYALALLWLFLLVSLTEGGKDAATDPAVQ